MSAVLAVLGFALLFAVFGAIGPRLRAGACHGCSTGHSPGCGECPMRGPDSEEADIP
jgi:hypothetical protein